MTCRPLLLCTRSYMQQGLQGFFSGNRGKPLSLFLSYFFFFFLNFFSVSEIVCLCNVPALVASTACLMTYSIISISLCGLGMGQISAMDILSGSGNKLVSAGVIFHISFLDTLMTFLKRGESVLPPWTAHSGAGWALSASHFGTLVGHPRAMAPDSSTLAWKIPWTEEPGRLQSMVGFRRVRHD